MEGDFIKLNSKLLPLSWLYGLGVKFRNMLFEINILKSKSYSVPVISVGNITVGGSGKTPHVEYLIELLSDQMQVAVLSRGYKRKSKGYVLATSKSTVADIGDEPLQMKRKFGKVHVAVDADRCEGIERLTSDDTTSNTEVILLDDAYQHRYVKPGINILLVDYHRLISYDRLLPAGRLREPREGKSRADIVIVTKCPTTMKPMDYRVVTRNLDLYPYQTLLFSHLRYGDLHPMYCGDDRRLDSLGANEHVLLLTGIAQPQQMMMDMEVYCKHITPMTFADHHAYTPEDIERINSTYASLPEPRLIITTEKDAARLHGMEGLTDDVRHHMYTLPVRVEFLNDNAETFHNKIFTYLKKDVEKSGLVRRQQAEREAQAAKENNGKKSPDKPRTISF